MAHVSAKCLDGMKKALHEMGSEWTGGVCKGAAWWPDGREVQCGAHTACHSWVGSAYYKSRDQIQSKKGDGLFVIGSCSTDKRCVKSLSESRQALVKWVARESVFAEYVINADDDASLLTDGVLILCGGEHGAPHYVALWICKVLRYAVEGGQAVTVWHELVQGGVNPYLALLVASYVRTVQGAKFSYTGVYQHMTVFGSAYEGPREFDVRSLISAKPRLTATSTNTLFSEGEITLKGKPKKLGADTISSWFKQTMKDDGWGKKVPCSSLSKEELLAKVLAVQTEVDPSLLKPEAPAKPKRVRKTTPSKSAVYLDIDM